MSNTILLFPILYKACTVTARLSACGFSRSQNLCVSVCPRVDFHQQNKDLHSQLYMTGHNCASQLTPASQFNWWGACQSVQPNRLLKVLWQQQRLTTMPFPTVMFGFSQTKAINNQISAFKQLELQLQDFSIITLVKPSWECPAIKMHTVSRLVCRCFGSILKIWAPTALSLGLVTGWRRYKFNWLMHSTFGSKAEDSQKLLYLDAFSLN